MGSEKISQMADASDLDGTEFFPIVQNGLNKQCTFQQVFALLARIVGAHNVCISDGTTIYGDDTITSITPGALRVQNLTYDQSIEQSEGGVLLSPGNIECFDGFIACNSSITGNPIVDVLGFSGSGSYTTFNFVNGILRGAT